MLTLPVWLLPFLLCGVWVLLSVVSAAELAVSDSRRGHSAEQRRGVSIFPGLPFGPLLFWGVAWLTDRWFYPWGSLVIGAFHLLAALWLVVVLIRCIRSLRRTSPA